jgi:glycogen synthase
MRDARCAEAGRMMRVVFISGEYPPDIGGVADYTYHLAHAVVRLGHNVSVLTSAAPRRLRRLRPR